jgi:hypothetical protein
MPRRKVAVVTVEAMAVDMVEAITAVDTVGVITAVAITAVVMAARIFTAAGISAAGVISADPRAAVRLSPYTTR